MCTGLEAGSEASDSWGPGQFLSRAVVTAASVDHQRDDSIGMPGEDRDSGAGIDPVGGFAPPSTSQMTLGEL